MRDGVGKSLFLAFAAILLVISAGASLLITSTPVAEAVEPGNEHFERTWARTDRPVIQGQVSRTWMWGPEAFTEVMIEEYVEGPGGEREVQYFDKARMEITAPDADSNSIWYVTNGLLVVELITGQMQVGHDEFVERFPAEVPVAGDPDDTQSPMYANLQGLLDMPPIAPGASVTQVLDGSGQVTNDPSLADQRIIIDRVDEVTNHSIAEPFWDFMTSTGPVEDDGQVIDDLLFENPYFATGRPIIEPYWADVLVAGTRQLVLLQCFERRCLTYTPQNDPGWQVEAGNVGLHYYRWRYESGEPEPEPTPTPEPPAGDPARVRINEVMYAPEAGESEWVELVNTESEDVPLGETTVTNGDHSRVVRLPDWRFPPDTFLRVVFDEGDNDDDFSDGSGVYYAGTTENRPFFTRTGAAVYGGETSAGSIVDFVDWAYLGQHRPGQAHDHAVTADIWNQGAYLEAYGNEPLDAGSHIRRHIVTPGESIGRNRDAADTNSPADWDVLGGAHALGPTPGAPNQSDFYDLMSILLSGESGTLGHELAQAPAIPQPQKSWTIMIYWDSRDRLSKPNMRDLQDVVNESSNADVNLVFLMAGRGASTRAYLEDGALWHVATDREPNPGDPDKLADFVSWSKANFPAERYGIVFSGHGRGWKGVFPTGPQDDFLTMAELDEGLDALGERFDFVGFDSCLMANVEVAHQLSDRAQYMWASEQINWGHMPWTRIIQDLKANPDRHGGEISDMMAGHYADRYDEIIGNAELWTESGRTRLMAYTWSSIDLDAVSNSLVPAINSLATALLDDVDEVEFHDFKDDNGQIVIKDQARWPVKEYHDTNFIDLDRFASLIGSTLLDASFQAAPVMQAVDEAVRVMRKGSGDQHANSNGLSIYFPRTLLLPNHRGSAPASGSDTPIKGSSHGYADPLYDPHVNVPTAATHLYKLDANILLPMLRGQPHPMPDDPAFQFPNDTMWDEFLHRYYKPVADACIRIGTNCVTSAELLVGQTVPLSGNGSSDSDGPEGPYNDEPAHASGHEHYYWDFDTDADNPAPLPDYQTGHHYDECDVEDCDRDEHDGSDDDRDAVGKLVNYTCTVPGTHTIRLIVWDEHHDQVRVSSEDERHNDGRHWLHFNVDSAEVVITCSEPETPTPTEPVYTPTKDSQQDSVFPGDRIDYVIVLPAVSGEEPVGGQLTDQLDPEVAFYLEDSLTCSSGFCEFLHNDNRIVWEGVVGTAEPVQITFSVITQSVPPEGIEQVENCADATIDQEQHRVCTTTTLASQSTESTATTAAWSILAVSVVAGAGILHRRRRS